MKKQLLIAVLLGVLFAQGASAAATAASKKSATTAGKKSPHKVSKNKAVRSSKQALAPAKKGVRKVALSEWEGGRLALYSSSALVIDQTSGETLYEKSPGAVLPIASITKLMTAMVVLDAKLNMQEVISIGEEEIDTQKGTRSRLPVGATMTRETAMLLALMSSENRAAHALGRHYPGGLPAFVAAMNQKSRDLGMTHTRFEEPTGLSSNNVSTARELVKMVSAAANYPEIRLLSTTSNSLVEINGRPHQFNNTNALVKNDRWEIGVSKTGFINEAGRCLVMQAKVADKPVVIVLLDSVGKMTRVGDANRIKRWMESASLPQASRRA